MIYGYARISTQKQNIERQIRNILKYCPDAIIKQEVYTGTKTDGRKVFEQLLKIVSAGDTIIFDSVSRMSRNAETGFQVYQELYEKGVELVFLKEPHINTETYKKALSNNMSSATALISNCLMLYLGATHLFSPASPMNVLSLIRRGGDGLPDNMDFCE